MKKGAVIFGTDGNSDYVEVDKKRYSLGPVSVLTLVSGLVRSPRAIRAAMNEFLEKRQVQLQVDLDAMWKLLPVRRARYSSVEDAMNMNKWKIGSSEPQIKTAADANADLVESILRRVAEAGAESLALEGKGFPASAVEARVELIRIASIVGELAEGDLADPQTRLDLYQLNSDVNRVLATVKVSNRSINYHGYQITESYRPNRRLVLESSDESIHINWVSESLVDVNIVTDDDETHERIPESKLAGYLKKMDARLDLQKIEESFEDE